jgi:hypothetical protein
LQPQILNQANMAIHSIPFLDLRCIRSITNL